MKKNIILVIFSIIFSTFLIEIILNFSGKYKNLTNIKLTPSDSIYERPHSSIQKQKHPDLNYIVTNFFDNDGVKNFEALNTSKKKNIIGIFGDSFTENIAVDRRFEYSNLINNHLKDHTIVNYGIGGYSADQTFLRYLKYKTHDLNHVFYFFMPGDIGFATKIKFSDEGDYQLEKKKINYIYQLIGKLNLTYFAIDSFYLIRSLLSKKHSIIDKGNYNSVLANKIYSKFYSKNLKKCINNKDACERNFLNLLNAFKNVVEKNNSTFHLLIYPNDKHILDFEKIISQTDIEFDYFILNKNLEYNYSNREHKYQFKNDGHWNEYGNVLFADNLISIFNDIDQLLINK